MPGGGATMPEQREATGFGYDLPPPSGRETALGFAARTLRARPRTGRFVRPLAPVLLLVGLGLLVYPFATDLYAFRVRQATLADELDALGRPTLDRWEQEIRGRQGAPLGRIVVPSIGLDSIVVEGVAPADLRSGPGHYPETPHPGEPGNVAIAGHRTTYGRPFNQLDRLQEGDELWLLTPIGDHRYVVAAPPRDRDRNPFVTDAGDRSVIGPTRRPSLTLTTEHPKGSGERRLVVRAVLEESLAAGSYDRS